MDHLTTACVTLLLEIDREIGWSNQGPTGVVRYGEKNAHDGHEVRCCASNVAGSQHRRRGGVVTVDVLAESATARHV